MFWSRKILLTGLGVLLGVPLIYGAVWFYFASFLDHEIRLFMDRQEQAHKIQFNGTVSFPTGFPGAYTIRYSGDIDTPHGTITLPLLKLSGWPLEGQEISAQAPMGATLSYPEIHADMRRVQSAALTFVIPEDVPARWTHARLKIWQAEGKARLNIRNMVLQWRDASLIGEGTLSLDKNVQPRIQAQIGVTNYTYFINVIADQQFISERAKFFLLSALSMLDTGDGVVTLPLLIKDRSVYLNMVRLGELPFIRWPRSFQDPALLSDPPPAPPQ